MKDNISIIQDISLLYELSLAVGKSLDLQESCEHFLGILLRRKSLYHAALWLRESDDYQLAYASAQNKAAVQQLSADAYIPKRLMAEDCFAVQVGEPAYQELDHGAHPEQGSYAVFQLEDQGFLQLFSLQNHFNARKELVQLLNVVKRFSLHIKACQTHANLLAANAHRSKIQKDLFASEAKLRKIIDTSLDAVITIDEKGIITEWNQNAERTFGYSRQEAMGRSMTELIIPHQHRQAHERGMQHFLRTGEGPVLNKRIEITAINRDEHEFPVELSITPIQLGRQYFFSGFIRDITERKEAEAALLHAKQTAEQARLAEQQFLANMSHEIRTPMNAVIGMTHLLYETQPNASQKEYLDALRFSADSLMGLINNILDLSKIEAGELAFEKKTFDLVKLLKGLQQTFQFKVREKPVSVTIDIDPKIKNMLIGDLTRLNQILTNLLGNASKFTKRGTIGIRAKLLASTAAQYVIQFQVHDTGIGIEMEKLDLIFQNFKQADLDTTRKYGGSGLGLTIVKQLVELQGGSIVVESVKQKGSIFSVNLPFENSGQEASELSDPIPESRDIQQILGDRHLLVVEDNPMNQKLIGKILDLWSCTYTIAPDGRAAWKLSRQRPYDLVLMDIHMPEMDGVEATQVIRSDRQNPNNTTPIIALTAAALLDEKNRALEAGMNDYLTKPFSPAQLQQVLEHWLENRDIATEPLLPPPSATTPAVDLSFLKSMSTSDQQFVPDMIQIFLREIPKALQQMHEAFSAENWLAIADLAHRINSNYMMMGLSQQQTLAMTLERQIKQEEIGPTEIQQMIQELDRDSKLVYPTLEQELKSLQN